MPESSWHAPSQYPDDGGPPAYSDRPFPAARRDRPAPRGYRSGPRSRPPARPARPGGGLPHWLGARPGRFGVSLVTGSTVLGMLACLFTGSGPGPLLNVFLLAGTVAAVLCVRPRAAYLIIPVPALAYLTAAMITGLVSDRAADTSRTAVLISAAQWVAAGFLAMTVATLLVIAVTAGYWLVRWRASRLPGRGPVTSRYRDDDDDYPAGDDAAGDYRGGDYRGEESWPAWNPPPDR
jgi:hypothetical protein